MKKCPSCGRAYSDILTECVACGIALSGGLPMAEVEIPAKKQVQTQKVGYQVSSGSYSVSSGTVNTSVQPPEKKKESFFSILMGALIGSPIVAAICWFIGNLIVVLMDAMSIVSMDWLRETIPWLFTKWPFFVLYGVIAVWYVISENSK